MTHEAVFIGGPVHGEVRAYEGDAMSAPMVREFPTMQMPGMPAGSAIYRRRAKADTPGRIAYVYDPAPRAKDGCPSCGDPVQWSLESDDFGLCSGCGLDVAARRAKDGGEDA
jgi:hypothetical protein